MSEDIIQIYGDKEKTKKQYPITTTEAIISPSGKSIADDVRDQVEDGLEEVTAAKTSAQNAAASANSAATAANNAATAASVAATHQPYINSLNLHWMIYSNGEYVDTGVVAEGKDGEDGKRGPIGPQGSDAAVTKPNIEAALGYTPANDSGVAHKTGDETINGDKTFNGMTFFKDNVHIERNLMMAFYTIQDVGTPCNDADAANKEYVDAKYTKPSTGIPESDLAQAVKTKLNTTTPVVDNLTSDSSTSALSAKQGKALDSKIGNLSELETTDKSSIVNAINEARQSGGGGGSTTIVDNLESDSTTSALSAKQGKVINMMINGESEEYTATGQGATMVTIRNVPLTSGKKYILKVSNHSITYTTNYGAFAVYNLSYSGTYLFPKIVCQTGVAVSADGEYEFVCPDGISDCNIEFRSEVGRVVKLELRSADSLVYEVNEIKESIDDINSRLIVKDDFTMVGAANTAVRYNFGKLTKGHTYRLIIDDPNYSRSSAATNHYFFQIYYYIGSNGVIVEGNMKNRQDDLAKIHTFTAIEADYYGLLIRADIGTNPSFVLADVTAIMPKEGNYTYSYRGASMKPTHGVDVKIVASKAFHQGAAYYKNGSNEYIVGCADNLASIVIYNGSTYTTLATITPSLGLTCHCNTISFGASKYDSADTLPLLYCPSEADSVRCIYVLRIANDFASVSLVQTIHLPSVADMPIHWANGAIDTELKRLVVSGYTNGSHSAYGANIYNGDTMGIYTFAIPSISTEDVTLSAADILQSFTIPAITTTQGFQVMNGKIFQAYGIPTRELDPTLRLAAISLHTESVINCIDLGTLGIATEPEGLFIKDGKIYIDLSGSLAELDFE